MHRILFICPTYGQFDYAKRCVTSFFQHSGPDDYCLVVDDASPEVRANPSLSLTQLLCPEPFWPRFEAICFPTNGGLTRSWNAGLSAARGTFSGSFEYAICGNSDILFTPNCLLPLIQLLERPNWKLVGPVTNCPGAPQYGAQNVKHFVPDYQVTDDELALLQTTNYLQAHHPVAACITHLNGFFLMAKTATWWEGAFDAKHVFNPHNTFNSKGQRNPTPLMTLNEDELQRRWREKGWQIGFTPASFIFHYRAASRGAKYARVEGAYRLATEVKEE